MEKGLIVSIQGYSRDTTQELADKIISCGIVGIRTDKNIVINKPIIALQKLEEKKYYITTDILAINQCLYGQYIAIDSRRGNQDINLLYAYCQLHGIKIVADIECMKDFDNILEMHNVGCYRLPDYFATTFSFLKTGYPDFEMIKKIKKMQGIKVIAEGKYKTYEDVKKAYDYGADNVCIGSEISDVKYLTNKFI